MLEKRLKNYHRKFKILNEVRKIDSTKKYNIKLKLVFIESVITFSAFGFCMPIMTVFWNSIGMNQTLIGLSQALCTLAMLLFDIPMGYIADRFDRKKMNLIGDIGIVVTFFIYMMARNFFVVIIGEILCGIFTAMTNGVDNSFLKFYSDKVDNTGKLYKENNAKLSIYQFAGFAISILIGMGISKYNLRIAIGAVAIPHLIGAILSLFIDDIGPRMENATGGNHLKDLIINVKNILKNKELKWLVFGYATVDNITRTIVWVLSPLLIAVGVPVHFVGIGWLLNYVTPLFGAMIAKKMQNLKMSNKLVLPIVLVVLGTLPIIINLNIWTVWLFALTGLAQGFRQTFFISAIQEKTKDEYQTTILSITTTASRVLYFPTVYIVNQFGNVRVQNALIANLLIFLPISIIIYFKLKNVHLMKCSENG